MLWVRTVRKLATGCLAFSAAVFAANYILPVGLLPLLALPLAAFGAGLLVMRRKWLRSIIISLIAFALGLSCFYIHYQRTTVPAKALDGQTLEVTGRLLEYPTAYDDYCRGRILLQTDGLPKLQAIVYDSSMTLVAGEPGQTVRFKARFSSADVRYGQQYDYYNSRDIYLILNTRSEVRFSESGFVLSALPAKIAKIISEKIECIFPSDTAVFMKSLMLGDRSELYDNEGLYLAMSRAGFMHVVAVSGMHIAFLVSLLQLLFGKTRKSSLVCISLVWLFVLVTGTGPSAVRAGIMQSLLLFAPIVDRENDSVTSLSFALGLLLLFNPYAAASVSLQLSFAAMAGIYCLADRIGDALLSVLPAGHIRQWLRYPVNIMASSVSVMAFTVPLTAMHFGYVSILSPLTNILGLWAVSICFCGGYIVCALAAVFPQIGMLAAWLVSWPVRYIFLLVKLISSVSFSAIYTESSFVGWWIVLCYGLFIIAAVSRASVMFKILLPSVLSAIVLAASLGTTKANYASGRGVISVLDVGQGQCISVFSGDKTLLIDCGGLGTADSAGETAGAYLSSCGRNKVDALLLTHLHSDHANGVTMLMEMADVELILMPADPGDDDGLFEEILESAKTHNTEIRYISEDEILTFGGITAQLFAPSATGGINERCVMAQISIDDYDMLVTADAPKSAERELIASHEIRNVELLIAGHHGSRYASCGELLGSIGADTVVISVGYNTYGHPTYEILERLEAYGYNIYRTDLNGTVEFRIG